MLASLHKESNERMVAKASRCKTCRERKIKVPSTFLLSPSLFPFAPLYLRTDITIISSTSHLHKML